IITLCILFGVFFTSKYWMYDDSAIAQTDYDKSINGLSQTTLTLRSWEYNPTNHLMEVTIEREHTGTDAVEPSFTFEAKGKETKDLYPGKKVYESDDIMVIHIENIPSTYYVIGLFVTEHRDNKILKQEYKKQFKDDNNEAATDVDKMEQSTLPKPEEVIIVGDYRKIKENKNLVIKSEKEYKKENIIEEMKRIEKANLKQDMKNETKEEKDQSEKEIEQKENAIASAEEEIEQYKNHVKELKEKYENREEKLEALLHPEREIEKEKPEKTDKNKEKKEKKEQQQKKQKETKKKEKAAKNKEK